MVRKISERKGRTMIIRYSNSATGTKHLLRGIDMSIEDILVGTFLLGAVITLCVVMIMVIVGIYQRNKKKE